MGLLDWLNPLSVLKDGLLQAQKQYHDAENDTQRIQAERDMVFWREQVEAGRISASVVQEGMKHQVFWVAWSTAAIPTALWFGWGMMDSLFNGQLPDVAALPPQLKVYADIVFGNIFYSGAALGSAQMIASAIRTRR